MLLKWSIVKSTSETKPQRKAYHLKDTSLLCDFKILFVRNLLICFYEKVNSISWKTIFFCQKAHHGCQWIGKHIIVVCSVFTFFYVEINFCLRFMHKMAISQFLWARSHYDVIVTSYIIGWHLFWYQWKEDVHTYTLVVKLGLYDLQYWWSGGGLQQPPWENMLGKTLRITMVNSLNTIGVWK